MPIILLPVLGVSGKMLDDLKAELGNTFLSRVEIAPAIGSLPDKTYDKAREQYEASKLVEHLASKSKGLKAEKVIAVGTMDLFAGDMNFVFGIAQKGGRLGLVSLYRLDQRFHGKTADYEKLKERAVKEAIHELGHCYGLEHCKGKCVMAFSNNIMEVDEKEKFFCESCREKLRKAL